MCSATRLAVWIPALLTLFAARGAAQGFEVVGTRAQGMGSAFVAVADDASAVYWNPAGLAGGAFFSLVLDGGPAEAIPNGGAEGATRSNWLLALSTPPLGLSYYRLGRDTVTAVFPADAGMQAELGALGLDPASGALRRQTLITHHLGGTLLHSLTDSLAVGATLKAVRGIAGEVLLPGGDLERALRDVDLIGRSSTRFDADLGIISRGALGSVGLLVRNVTRPAFRTSGDVALHLERQVRAGASILLLPKWRVASDLDLTRRQGLYGDVREFAAGAEGQVTRRFAARAGVRVNTAAGDEGRTPSASAGASYAVIGAVQIDGQITAGPDTAFRGWSVAARLVF